MKQKKIIIYAMITISFFLCISGVVISFNTIFNMKHKEKQVEYLKYGISNSISLTNTYPLKEDKAHLLYSNQEYQEMVINLSNNDNLKKLEYFIVLTPDKETNLDITKLVYSLSLDGIKYTPYQHFNYDFHTNSAILYSSRLTTQEENVHLRIWILETNQNQDELQNKTFKGTIDIYYKVGD